MDKETIYNIKNTLELILSLSKDEQVHDDYFRIKTMELIENTLEFIKKYDKKD